MKTVLQIHWQRQCKRHQLVLVGQTRSLWLDTKAIACSTRKKLSLVPIDSPSHLVALTYEWFWTEKSWLSHMFSRFRLRHITTHHRLFPRLGCSSLVLFFCVDHLLFAPRVDFLCCVSVLVLLFPSLAFLCLCALLFCPPHSFLSSCSSRCPSCWASQSYRK